MPAKQRSCQGCEHHLAMRGVPQADYQGEQHFCTFNGPPLDSNRPGEWLGFLPFPSSQCLCPLEVFGEGYAGVYGVGRCGPEIGSEALGEVAVDGVGDGVPGDQSETRQREVAVDDPHSFTRGTQRTLAFD